MVEKEALIGEMLERSMVMLTVDARAPGVEVPPRLRQDPQLRLNLSYRFGLQLELGPWGIHTTLTFGGVPHSCKLPWSAIYQVFSHQTSEQYVFLEDVPDDLAALLAEDLPAVATEQGEAKEERRPRLSIVPPLADEAPLDGEAPSPQKSEEPEPAPSRAHLRRIK